MHLPIGTEEDFDFITNMQNYFSQIACFYGKYWMEDVHICISYFVRQDFEH